MMPNRYREIRTTTMAKRFKAMATMRIQAKYGRKTLNRNIKRDSI